MKHPARHLLPALLVLAACDDLERCPEDRTFRIVAAVTAGTNVDPGTADLTLRGTLNARINRQPGTSIRVDRFTIAGISATADTLNFATWHVTIPNSVLRQERSGRQAKLTPVVATDVCGQPHTMDDILIPLDGRAGEPAPGLAVTVEAESGGCYLPADGSQAARVQITADAEAVGVPVTLSAPAMTTLGVAAPVLVARGSEAGADTTLRLASATPPKSLLVVASAGPDSDASEGLPVVGVPTIDTGPLTIPRGATRTVRVRTRGQLGACQASVSHPAGTSVRLVDPDVDLTARHTFSDAACGVSHAVALRFEPTVPDGATILLECEDLYSQPVEQTWTAGPATGANAPGLTVAVAPAQPGECYIPADGTLSASIVLGADPSAAGVAVKLETNAALGITPSATPSLQLDGERAAASAGLRVTNAATAPGRAVVVASAGSAAIFSEPLRIAGKPAFITPAAAQALPDRDLVVLVSTDGRLARCTAIATDLANTTVTSSSADLIADGINFSGPDCEQRATFTVRFAAGIATGNSATVRCVDTAGQAAEASIAVQIPEGT